MCPIARPAILALAGLALLASACAKRYPIQAMVLQVNPAESRVTVSHREIPGVMDAMVMSFPVRRAEELRGLRSGAQIESRLVMRERGSYLENIRVKQGTADGAVEDQIALPALAERAGVGDLAQDFTLNDQDGAPVRLSDLHGRVVAINFIYTRCPVPEVCPRLSANFASAQRRFSQSFGKDLTLLSITLDPQHDTPEELRKYAKIWNARREGWRFLTGAPDAVQRVAERFGMTYWPEEGLITHTSITAVIARDGRIGALIEGSSYRAKELGDLIEKELEK
jgi:protein SCO1